MHQSVAATNFSGQLSANASINDGTKLTIRETSLASARVVKEPDYVTTLADSPSIWPARRAGQSARVPRPRCARPPGRRPTEKRDELGPVTTVGLR